MPGLRADAFRCKGKIRGASLFNPFLQLGSNPFRIQVGVGIPVGLQALAHRFI